MGKYKYFAQHMHMHSCYQPGASMEGHMYHASRLGMQYIWITDHDIHMGRKMYRVDGFDFEKDVLYAEEENGRFSGFQPLEGKDAFWEELFQGEKETFRAELTKEDCFQGTQCLKISACSDNSQWKGGGVWFWSSPRRHCGSLMAGCRLEISVKWQASQDSRVILDVRLSQRPPEHECAHLLYVLGSTEGLEERSHVAVFPLASGEGWQKYTLDLSRDVMSEYACSCGVGGLDNAFDTINIIVESRNGLAGAYFDDFRIHFEKDFEPVHEIQKRVAMEIGQKYHVTPFVSSEISYAGPHKNCFSTKVPIIPYDRFDYQVSHEDAIAWIKKHAGIFSMNHPFEKYKRQALSEAEKEEMVEETVEEYSQNKVWGATLIEVGFPSGRHGFSLEQHLRLWDKLSENGIFLTGYGCSDNHSNKRGWYEGMNFAAWFGVGQEEAEPVREEAFILAMKQGRCYTGNPVLLKGEISFETEDGIQMGTVLEAGNDQQCQTVRFRCSEARPGWQFRLIENGQVAVREVIAEIRGKITAGDDTTANLDFEYSYTVRPRKKINFVRVELYDENGICIMLTNPIYIWRSDLGEIELAPERKA